jgi:hypothetical protein
VPVFRGKLHHGDSGWRILIDDHRALQKVISQAGSSNPVVENIPFQYHLFKKLVSEEFDLEAFNDQLHVKFKSPNYGPLQFVRVSQSRLSGIGALLNAFVLYPGHYFRCALDKLADDNLLELARKHLLLMNETDVLYYRTERESSTRYFAAASDVARRRNIVSDELNRTRAGQAARTGKFGAYLGCPERDRN